MVILADIKVKQASNQKQHVQTAFRRAQGDSIVYKYIHIITAVAFERGWQRASYAT